MVDKRFKDEYRAYVKNVIVPVHSEVARVIDKWRAADFWLAYQEDGASIPQPIQNVKVRDKRLESILDKFKRQPKDFPGGAAEPDNLRVMRDVLGARIVVYVPDQLRLLDKAIRNSSDLTLEPGLKPRCYLPKDTFERIKLNSKAFDFRGAKQSGYASVHYFVRLANPVADENPIFEIQTRTMLEEVWGEIEHQLGYKTGEHTEFSVARQFRVLSHQLDALDDHFDFLYDRLTYLQSMSNPQDQDLLNAENLPRIMHDHQLLLRQSEVDSLLRILHTNRLRKVKHLRQRLTPTILNAIRADFATLQPDTQIGAFDVIPAIAVLGKGATEAEARRAFSETYELGELVRHLRVDIKSELRSRRGGGA